MFLQTAIGTAVAVALGGVIRMRKLASWWLLGLVQAGCAAGMQEDPIVLGEPMHVVDETAHVEVDSGVPERCVATFDSRGEPCEICIDGAGIVTVNSCMVAPPDEAVTPPDPEVATAPEADASQAMPVSDGGMPEADAGQPGSEADAAQPGSEADAAQPGSDAAQPGSDDETDSPTVDANAACRADPMGFGGATLTGVLEDWLRVVGVNAGLRAPTTVELRSLDGPSGISGCFDVIRYAIEHYGDGSFTAFLDPSAIFDCVGPARSCRMIQVVDLGAVQACLRVPVGCNQLVAGQGIAAAETYALSSLCSADRPWECIGSPLVVDLASDGLALKGPGDGARFAIAGAAPMDVGWLRGGSDDALLALDLDGSGCVEGGGELFGESTGGGASDGFAALARYDDNRDGRVDAQDAVFSSLLLWHDDGDGRCDSSELAPAAAHGVESIALQADRWSERDAFGNELGLLGRALVNGRSVPVVDVWFRMVAR